MLLCRTRVSGGRNSIGLHLNAIDTFEQLQFQNKIVLAPPCHHHNSLKILSLIVMILPWISWSFSSVVISNGGSRDRASLVKMLFVLGARSPQTFCKGCVYITLTTLNGQVLFCLFYDLVCFF